VGSGKNDSEHSEQVFLPLQQCNFLQCINILALVYRTFSCALGQHKQSHKIQVIHKIKGGKWNRCSYPWTAPFPVLTELLLYLRLHLFNFSKELRA
jgi:hypothetical protein